MKLTYRVGAREPARHLFDVGLTVEGVNASSLTLRLPDWIPGSYMIRDYARHVVSLDAHAAAQPLGVQKLAKSTWEITTGGASTIEISLRVYAWDLSVRGAHLDQTHAYFNGTCLFPEVVGHAGEIDLVVDRPLGLSDDAWVATSMRAQSVDARGYGRYRIHDYAELIDHPVEIAEQVRIAFEAAGIEHLFVIRDAGDFDHDILARDVAQICAAQHELLGTPEDLDRYVFLAYAVPGGYGGLEHRWSSSLVVDRDALPQTGDAPSSEPYRDLLGLISHEYFHLWNVRRLKPKVMSPPDLTREVHTGLLWVFEGITSYYDDLMLVRSGVIDEEAYLSVLGRLLTRVHRTPGRHEQTLEASSFDAWTRFYKQDENAVNAIISYYAKGALAALALDLHLRANSASSLDDVMREAWSRFYLNGDGMPERGLETVAAEVSGLDLSALFDTLIRSTEDIDLARALEPFGVSIQWRRSGGPNDKGGRPLADTPAVWSGLAMNPKHPQQVARVVVGSPAAAAGLSAGDELVAIDGYKGDGARLTRLLARSQPGKTLSLSVFRGDRLLTMSLTLAQAPEDTAWLTVDDRADASARRQAWLRGDAHAAGST